MKKRLLALLLCAVLCVGLLPGAALAAEGTVTSEWKLSKETYYTAIYGYDCYWWEYAYDDNGLLREKTLYVPNNKGATYDKCVTHYYKYDNDGHLTVVEVDGDRSRLPRGGDGSYARAKFYYTFDANGMLTETETMYMGDGADGKEILIYTEMVEYDYEAGLLTKETVTNIYEDEYYGDKDQFEYAYEYDEKGQTVKKTTHFTQSGQGEKYETYGESTYEYDEKGNVVKLRSEYTTGSTYTWTYVNEYDKDGNLLKITRYDDESGMKDYEAEYTKIDASSGDTATGFTDVPVDSYYADAVQWAMENEITNGTSKTAFSPGTSCTRAQTVTFLWRTAGSPESAGTDNPFTDVSGDAYYFKAVMWAIENGITEGTSETTFSPNVTCTRAQIVTFLYRAAGSPAVSGSAGFLDVVGDTWYAAAVAWAVENGITNGTSADTFSPDDSCTRAQIITFLYRSVQQN